MALKRSIVCIFLLSLLLSLTGCAFFGKDDVQPETAQWAPTPEPVVRAEPAEVLTGVETDRKVVSLIFEGFTDSATMEAIADVLKQRGVSATFFISGITANEYPELVKGLLLRGFDIGSYGMSGGKHLEELSAYENLRRFELAQREIQAACGKAPELIRCNGTVYTEQVLRAVTAAGLKAAVQPTAYLNHKSFREAEDAELYATNVLRGSILSVKLGQELDRDEYGDPGEKLDERPAIDPGPGIRWEWSTEDARYAALPDLVAWLVDALLADGYRFTDPVSLQAEKRAVIPKLHTLDAEEQRLLDPASYTLPLTEEPLRAGEQRAAAPGSFHGAVFVGDSVMAGLASYVEWQRQTESDLLDDARFLTENQLTVEALLDGETETGDLGSRLREMNAKSVWLCLSFANRSAFQQEAYLAKYRLLIKQIQDQNPDIRVVILSVLPKVDQYAGISNSSRFVLNLRLCGMCREYEFPFVDIASAVRDERGQLREDYCLDLAGRGCHLNDAGCAAVLEFIMENNPV